MRTSSALTASLATLVDQYRSLAVECLRVLRIEMQLEKLFHLQTPELLYKSLVAKLIVGMPFKDLATVDSIPLRELPPADDSEARLAIKRLADISMGVLVPLSEQLTKPLAHAIFLVNLQELSAGAHKLLPEGTRLAVILQGHEAYEDFDLIKSVDPIMLLINLANEDERVNRVHTILCNGLRKYHAAN